MYKSKRSKACDISAKTKQKVWKRDKQKCVICGSHNAMPNAHYISRAKGGLGIEQNIVTLCMDCHYAMDMTSERQLYLKKIGEYLKVKYPNFKDAERIYRK